MRGTKQSHDIDFLKLNYEFDIYQNSKRRNSML